MKHRLILVSTSALALALASAAGCSSDEGVDTGINRLNIAGASSAAPGGAGTSAVAAAGASSGPSGAAGGSSVSAGGSSSEGPPPATAPGAAGMTAASAPGAATAGAGGAGGAGGMVTGGAGGAPSPASNPGAACPAAGTNPSDGVACTVTCTDPCGIHNLGTRLCTCTGGVFDCATCEFAVMHPLLAPPGMPLAACELPDDAQEDDEAGCTDNERCQSVGRMTGATDGGNRFCGCLLNEWDCDTKPAGFDG